MSDSADIKVATEKLNLALKNLERVLSPMVEDYARCKKIANESGNFAEDRSRLAQDLDLAKSKVSGFEDREAEFSRLANETTAELDQVISQVRNVLERE